MYTHSPQPLPHPHPLQHLQSHTHLEAQPHNLQLSQHPHVAACGLKLHLQLETLGGEENDVNDWKMSTHSDLLPTLQPGELLALVVDINLQPTTSA